MAVRLSWLMEFSPTHAGTLVPETAGEDEESPNSWEDDTSSDSSDSGDSPNDSSNFCLMRGGVWLSFGTYFTHFPIPPPGNYCTVPKSRYGPANRAGSIFKQSLSYHWQAHIQKLHNRVKCSREYSTSAAFETKLGPKLRFSALKHMWTTVSVTR